MSGSKEIINTNVCSYPSFVLRFSPLSASLQSVLLLTILKVSLCPYSFTMISLTTPDSLNSVVGYFRDSENEELCASMTDS